MPDSKQESPFSRTKLFRPPVPADYVGHGQLLPDRLDGNGQRIIVVSAPAGYGKSTLISHWVDECEVGCAWVSLDDYDNDIRVFLTYLGASFDVCCPAAAETLTRISKSQELPSAGHIADAFALELDQVDGPLVLALDDYHNIHETFIHEFVGALLNHLPDCLSIVTISRLRPPLSLGRLRSRGLVLDIRLEDLQFNSNAVRSLAEQTTNKKIDDKIINQLLSVTEGWPAGLRMVLLALQGQGDLQAFLSRFKSGPWQIQDYLIEEVIDQLPTEIATSVCRISILDRFSAELCDAVLSSTDATAPRGEEVLSTIRSRGLFCISLDERGEWHRYHQLFRSLLMRQCLSRHSDEEIHELHRKAASWFDNEGLVEEAVRHALQADDTEYAAAIIVRHGPRLNEAQESHRLDRLLSMLPMEHVQSDVGLLILLGWNAIWMGRGSQAFEAIELADSIIRNAGLGDDDIYVAQLCALRAQKEYHLADGKASLESSIKALKLLPTACVFERAETSMLRAAARQMQGETEKGKHELYKTLQQSRGESEYVRSRVLTGLCYLNWMGGDLQEMPKNANALLKLTEEWNSAFTTVHACWFKGAALYHLNKLDEAAEAIQDVIDNKWWPHQRSYSNCVQIMALIHAARGEFSQAIDYSEALIDQNLESSATFYMGEANALRAVLAYSSGDLASASRWALDHEHDSPTAGWGFSVPALAAVRILLDDASDEAQQKADSILTTRESFYESTHNVRFLIETLALRALQYGGSGDDESALNKLQKAVALAEPSGFIRLFVDLGPRIVPLLNRLDLNEESLKFVGSILAGFPPEPERRSSAKKAGGSRSGAADLPEPLSKREQEVLELLVEHLTNKEIGERLFISPATVKRHAHNIYEKLSVSDRREAIAKATGLGLVSN